MRGGMPVSADRVLITSGTSEGIELARASIDGGGAMRVLDRLVALSNG